MADAAADAAADVHVLGSTMQPSGSVAIEDATFDVDWGDGCGNDGDGCDYDYDDDETAIVDRNPH